MSSTHMFRTTPSQRFRHGLRTAIIAILIVGAFFAASTTITVVQAQRGKVEDVKNPIASLLLQRFAPNPNMLVEDHVRISCEDSFSVKVFTANALHDAEFKVTDESKTTIFGATLVKTINPLWQKVWLKDLNPFPLPEKILVTMTAKTEDGKEVEHTLIVEPDCATHIHSVVNQLIVLNPIGKVLVNPIPPVDPNDPSEPLQLKAPDLTVAVPRDKVGDTIVVRLLDSGDQPVGGPCTIGPQTIPVEIVALSLQSCEPITVSPHSFFDVFYEIKIGDHTTNHPVRLIDASRLEDLGLETETGSGIITH